MNRNYLYEIYDLERLTGKVACSNLNPRDMLQLKNSLKVFPSVNEILKTLELEEIEKNIPVFKHFFWI